MKNKKVMQLFAMLLVATTVATAVPIMSVKAGEETSSESGVENEEGAGSEGTDSELQSFTASDLVITTVETDGTKTVVPILEGNPSYYVTNGTLQFKLGGSMKDAEAVVCKWNEELEVWTEITATKEEGVAEIVEKYTVDKSAGAGYYQIVVTKDGYNNFTSAKVIVEPVVDMDFEPLNGSDYCISGDGNVYVQNGITLSADRYQVGVLGEGKSTEDIEFKDSLTLTEAGEYPIWVKSKLFGELSQKYDFIYNEEDDEASTDLKLVLDNTPVSANGFSCSAVCTKNAASFTFEVEDFGSAMTHLFKKSDYDTIVATFTENMSSAEKRNKFECATTRIKYCDFEVDQWVDEGNYQNSALATIDGLDANTDYVAVFVYTDKVGNVSDTLFTCPFKTSANTSESIGSSSSSSSSSSSIDKPAEQKPETNPDGSTTQIVTNPDGSKTEVTKNTDGSTKEVTINTDGSKTEVTKNTDGSKKELTVNTDGSTKEVTTETDGSAVEVVIQTVKNSAGTEVKKTSTVKTTAAGEIISNVEKSDFKLENAGIANVDGTPAVVSVVVTKNAEGRVTDAKANMNLTVSKVGDIQISSSAIQQLKEAADGKHIRLVLTISRPKEKALNVMTLFATEEDTLQIEVDSKNVVPGKALKLYKKSGENYQLLKTSKKIYEVDQDGNLDLNGITDSMTGTYAYVSTAEAKKIDKEIKDSTKLAKSKLSLKKGKKATAKLSSKVDKANISKITYSVADKKIATVNSKGMIKAKKQGATNVVVKVTYKNGMTKTLNEKVTVK